jgi:hypothetical protein
VSLSNYTEDAFANTLRGGGAGTSFTAPAAVYAKLHLGDPGEDGTANAAAETTRKAVTFGASSGGVISLSNTPSWTSYPAAESVTHISIWDDETAGNCLGSGATAATHTMQIGDTLNLSAASIAIT